MAEAVIINNRKVKSREAFLNRIMWVLIGILFLFLTGEIIAQFFVIPNFLIKHITIESNFSVSKEAVLKLAGISDRSYYFKLNPELLAKRIGEYPLVRTAVVKKIFPDTLKIILTGRKPLAVALVEVNNRSIPVAMDEDGVIFLMGKSVNDVNMPVISGLKFKEVRVGTVLPEMVKPLLKDLYKLKENHPNLFKIISEIRIIPKGASEYELVFCPVSYNVKVRLGKRLEAKSLQYAMMVLDLLKDEIRAKKVEELDFREGNIVYKVRGE